jgi:hypothetical protein
MDKKNSRRSDRSSHNIDGTNKGNHDDNDYINQRTNIKSTKNEHELSSFEKNNQILHMYDNLGSAYDEVLRILDDVKNNVRHRRANIHMPWRVFDDDGGGSDNDTYKKRCYDDIGDIEIILDRIGLYPDGRPMPLSLIDRLSYGSRKRKLVSIITKARINTNKILIQLQHQQYNYHHELTLIQQYILEQFTPLTRYLLEKELSLKSIIPQRYISIVHWYFTWIFIVCSMLLCIYWILKWYLNQGGHNWLIWIITLLLCIAYDIIIIQTWKVTIVNIWGMFIIKPQLHAIYNVLINISMNFIQNHPNNSDGHSSLLRDNNLSMIQRLSPTCRASQSIKYNHLFIARIMRVITDRDKENCINLPLSSSSPSSSSSSLSHVILSVIIKLFLLPLWLFGNWGKYFSTLYSESFIVLLINSMILVNYYYIYNYFKFYIFIPYIIIMLSIFSIYRLTICIIHRIIDLILIVI